MPKRLDTLMVQRGLAVDAAEARALIEAGRVSVQGIVKTNARSQVAAGADIKLIDTDDDYVSRGAYKLLAGLEAFEVQIEGRVCMDVGASTGGFTDVLLRYGATSVYAIDVGYGQLAWRLRQDPRVITIERANIRNLKRESFLEAPEIAVADVSFISLTKIIEPVAALLAPQGDMILLIKPQFEAPRSAIEEGGVVRDPAVHEACIEAVRQHALSHGLGVLGVVESPLRGPAGNVEFLIHLSKGAA